MSSITESISAWHRQAGIRKTVQPSPSRTRSRVVSLAPLSASAIEVLIAVNFDVQPDALIQQRKVQLVPLNLELGVGQQGPELHGVEQEPLGRTVRAEFGRCRKRLPD